LKQPVRAKEEARRPADRRTVVTRRVRTTAEYRSNPRW